MVDLVDSGLCLGEDRWQEPFVRLSPLCQSERRAKIAATHKQKLIAEGQKLIVEKKKRQLEEAKRVMELDRNLIVIAVLIIALPIIAALAATLTARAVGDH
jgi:hypothetical protein